LTFSYEKTFAIQTTDNKLPNEAEYQAKTKAKVKVKSKSKSKIKTAKPDSTPLPKDSGTSSADEINTTDTAEKLYPQELGQDLSEMVLTLSNRLDSFFGEERPDDEPNGSVLRVVPSYTFYDGAKGLFELGVNLNLKLRNLEAKAKKIETSIKEELLPDKLTKNEVNQNQKKVNATKAKEEAESWHYNIESKLAARPAIYYSGKIKVRRGFEDAIFLHQFSLSYGWDTDDKWNQRTSFNTDRALSSDVLFRFSNDVTWLISRDSFQSSHGPSIIQTINKYNSVSYNMRYIMGILDETYQHIESNMNIHFRHGTPSKKIFVDLIPTYSYPVAQDFKENRSLQIRIEYLFGDIK
jgi:hypothetical protein